MRGRCCIWEENPGFSTIVSKQAEEGGEAKHNPVFFVDINKADMMNLRLMKEQTLGLGDKLEQNLFFDHFPSRASPSDQLGITRKEEEK